MDREMKRLINESEESRETYRETFQRVSGRFGQGMSFNHAFYL